MKRADPFATLLLTIFALSGFSGLIYEAIWSHYLGLYLGHAAYAQSLVLVIFMGGLAGGAWLIGRKSESRKNPLRDYAIIEGIVGLLGLIFHISFVWLSDVTHQTLVPMLGSDMLVSMFKWTAGGLLILPQSILLGMTFPLISAALVRRHSESSGETVSVLYFANSIGAAVGVLVATFYLMPEVGLPGAMLAAGTINIAIAAVTYLASGNVEDEPTRVTASSGQGSRQFLHLVLAASAMTGAASFVYEMAWIRMLSLALGTTLHSFEIMLSAFILGLALGGLWIRKRLDRMSDPQQFAGFVQIIMAIMALISLVIYSRSFDWVVALMSMLTPTDQGYAAYNFATHLIAMGVMVPTTFMAGMTLPLLTFMLLKRGYGEVSIGRVYATNTLGAILGVLFAVHIGFPVLGLEWMMGAGALIDLIAGIALLWLLRESVQKLPAGVATAAGVLALLIIPESARVNQLSMVSGAYRTGTVMQDRDLEFIKHGKTATVSVVRINDHLSIATNGKPDASVNIVPGGEASTDEDTMTMLGALPLAFRPDARQIANIGFGCGLTTHTILASPNLDYVDTIEIEPAMVEGARLFHPVVHRAFDDPRSRIQYEDAKTFFSKHRAQYDIIISEPSNPWVSGVASLFSDEFYSQVKRHINDDGIFVQWLQLYEIDDRLVASVFKALDRNFGDYRAYFSGVADIVIVASPNGQLGEPRPDLFDFENMRPLLERINIRSTSDFDIRLVGSTGFLRAVYGGIDVAINSDYFPILSLMAPATRFKKSTVDLLMQSTRSSLPIRQMLIGPDPTKLEHLTRMPTTVQLIDGLILIQAMSPGGEQVREQSLDLNWQRSLSLLDRRLDQCNFDTATRQGLQQLAEATLAGAPALAKHHFWNQREWLGCETDPETARQLNLYASLASSDTAAIAAAATKVMTLSSDETDRRLLAYSWLALQLARIAGAANQAPPADIESEARSLASAEFPGDYRLLTRIWSTINPQS